MTPMLLRELAELFLVEASAEPYLTPCARLAHHEVDPSDEEREHLYAEGKRLEQRAFVQELVDADEDDEPSDIDQDVFASLRFAVGG